MQSAFTPHRQLPGATSNPAVEETYNLRGINLVDPDEIMLPGQSPWTINSRMYARNDQENRVANRTRKGSGYLSTPIGETLNVVNTAGTTGDSSITTSLWVAQPFTPDVTGPLTRLDLNIKKATGATGHVITEIRTNVSNLPGILIAQGSIIANTVTTAYQYLPNYFIDAPTLTSGTQYWLVSYIQDNGSGTYYLNETATTSQAYSTTNAGLSWGALGYSLNYKTYISTSQGVRGFHLRYPSVAANNRIVIAHRGSIWSIPKATGIPALVDNTVADATTPVRFSQFDDKTLWVDGTGQARWWDGTTVSNIGGTIPSSSPSNIIVWQNRLFILSASTRVDFSDLLISGGTPTWSTVNFFYVPTALSPDHVTGWKIFQNNLVIFTHETKHTIIGSDISTFTRKEAVGTKGAVSQEAMASDRNLIYFMADDLQIYGFNGATDVLLSDKIQPELQGISDPSKVRLDIYRNQLRVYYPKSPSSTNNRMAMYDLIEKEWFLDTDHPVTGSANLYLDNNQLVEFSALTGQVLYGEIQGSDLGKKLDYKYWTNYKTYAYRRRNGQTFGGATSKKRIKRFRPIVRVTGSDFPMLVGKDMDFANRPDMRVYEVSSGGAKWGAFDWGDGTVYGGSNQIQNRSGMSGRGAHIQYRFERKGVETEVDLYGYAAMYKIGRQK
jgi:hypothetical protein